jgi:hypothetical protein
MEASVHILFFVLTWLACAILYLSHRHQGWLAQPLAATPWRAVGVVLLLLALGCGLAAFSAITAVFGWLMLLMLAFSVLPFFSLWIKRMRREQQA